MSFVSQGSNTKSWVILVCERNNGVIGLVKILEKRAIIVYFSFGFFYPNVRLQIAIT